MKKEETPGGLNQFPFRKGTYRVVAVGCNQIRCVDYANCQDNAVGLLDEDRGCIMICHDYRISESRKRGEDKRVYWRRK